MSSLRGRSSTAGSASLRVAPYSYDWLDNFGRQSPRQLTPGIERLSPGQRIFFMFRVAEFVENEQITIVESVVENEQLTLRSAVFEWVFGKVALTYMVVPRSASSCRIVTKCIVHDPLTFSARRIFFANMRRDYYPIAELPLMQRQLRTFKRLAEKQFLEELANGRRRVSVGDEQPRGNNVDSMGELVMQPQDGQ